MPIPALQDKELRRPPVLVEAARVSPAAHRLPGRLVPRVLAHAVDMMVLTGFSLYASRFFSVLLVALHSRAIAGTGKLAGLAFHEAFHYSHGQLFGAAFASLSALYFIAAPAWFGRTPGMGVFGLRIVAADGGLPGWRALVYRWALCAVSYGSLGLLCLRGLRQREGLFLHDEWSGTRVDHGAP